MALIIRWALNLYHHMFEVIKDPRSDNYPLIGGSPLPVFVITTAYIGLCYYGPKLMDSKEPIKLTKVIAAYNFTQVVICTSMGCYAVYFLLWENTYTFTCRMVDYRYNDFGFTELKLFYLYFLTKLLDLFDTIFIILKKKKSQLTFLHCYHHWGMVIAAYIGTKWIPGGHGIFLGVVNVFVHSIMYFYYFLTAFKPELKASLWWKKHITQVQLLQFAILTVHFARGACSTSCLFPKLPLAIMAVQNLFMLVIFGDFYFKTYVK